MFSFLRRRRETATKAASVTNERIIAAIKPWTLACCCEAENGLLGRVKMGFKFWYRMSRDNWLPEVMEKTGASERQVFNALNAYIQTNGHRHYDDILREEEAKRGMQPSVTLGPGESMEVRLAIESEE